MKSAIFSCCVLFLFAALPVSTAQSQEVTEQEIRIQYSLYWEYFKTENYVDARSSLDWILANAPAFPRNRDQNFERGVTLYEGLAEAAEDPDERRALLDSALAILDRAVPVMQSLDGEIDEFEWTLMKGRFIQKHVDDLEDVKEQAIEAYWGAYELQPETLDPYYIDVLIGDLYTNGDLGGALDFLREVQDARGEEEGVQGLVAKYFTVIPPEEQIVFLEEQLAENPDDSEVLIQLFELYEQEGYRDEMLGLAPQMLAMDPTPEVLRLLSRMYLEDGDADQAMAIFEQLSGMSGVELMPEDYHNMGIAHQDKENFGQARTFYRNALDIDPDFEKSLKAIPDLYATAASSCGISDREDAAVFWLIADAYSRAGDSAGAARMRTAFPSAEDIFYVQKWTVGESTQVSYSCRGLTISGTTTVRQQR